MSTAGVSKRSVLMCIMGLGFHQVQKALAPWGYFPIQRFFKLSGRAGRMPLWARFIFSADPSLGLQRGQGSQTYQHESPQTRYKGTHCADLSRHLPLMALPAALSSPLWKPLHKLASFSPDNQVQRWILFSSFFVLVYKPFSSEDSALSLPWFRVWSLLWNAGRLTFWEPAKPLDEFLCLKGGLPGTGGGGIVCSWSIDPMS